MADIWFDVDIAISECPVNLLPLIDDGDFKTIEAAVVFNQAGLVLLWHFVTTAGVMTETAVTPTTSGLHDWSDQGVSGLYGIEIPIASGDINNTEEGFGWFTGVATGVLPWRGPVIGFRAAKINNALIDDASMLTSLDIGLLYESVITTVTSVTEFIMATSFAHNDLWNGLEGSISDISGGVAVKVRIADCIDGTETIHIETTPALPFTVEAGVDVLRIYARESALSALNTFAPPKRSELTTDTNSILAKFSNAELTTDPGDAPSLAEIAQFLYQAVRNQRDTTGSSDEIHTAAGAVVVTATISDDGVLFRKTKAS